MTAIEQIKQRVDLHDLADRLGLKRGRGGEKANYHSPTHDDRTPSLSIYVGHPLYGTGWKDWSANEGGSAIDLVMYTRGCGTKDAIDFLCEEYRIPRDDDHAKQPERREKSQIEYIADKCLAQRDRARDYLKGRGISDAAIDSALKAGSLGFSTWTSPKIAAGESGFGGDAVAFIVRTPNPGHVVAVDFRYLDADKNGGRKTSTQGEKSGVGWTSDVRRLKDKSVRRVILVESAINALSIDSCRLPGTVAYAIRGIANASIMDLELFREKAVYICMDDDAPFPDGHPRAGQRPGPEAAWLLYERLTAIGIAAHIVDQSAWRNVDDLELEEPLNDVNDYLQARGDKALARALDELEPWLVPGFPGDDSRRGRSRIHLPAHDFATYWRFRVKPDFTTYIAEMKKMGESEIETPVYTDLCGFRIASMARVAVAGATSTMTGDPDQSPTPYFAVSVQVARHGAELQRRVLLDDQVHNVDQWGKFGPIWSPASFKRMVNILERSAHLGARRATNFVGLAWRDGELVVNEGPDCYFTDPQQQCPYSNLSFPSGPKTDAAIVIRAYQRTFKDNAATMALVWALGGHLKALLGFWPHMEIQAEKGAGKSTLIKRIERSIAFTMFSGQSIETPFRLLCSSSHTSHPVGWEELSARSQKTIDAAVALLQESYQYTVTRRGSEMTEFLVCAPVLLAGEDVPVKSLLGKLVRTSLTKARQGPRMPEELPRFPVKQWLQFLATLRKDVVLASYERLLSHCVDLCRAEAHDAGANRMIENYSAVLMAWALLCEFAGMDPSEGDFEPDLLREMNSHIGESSADRLPWVWIMETALSEMDANNFKHPYFFSMEAGEQCLLVRTSHVMDHLANSSHLRDKWNSLPVKSDRVFKKQLVAAGVIVGDREVERRVHGKRFPYLTPLSLRKLEQFGLYIAESRPNDES